MDAIFGLNFGAEAGSLHPKEIACWPLLAAWHYEGFTKRLDPNEANGPLREIHRQNRPDDEQNEDHRSMSGSFRSHLKLGQQILHHMPMHVGQTEIATLIMIGQFSVIDAELIEDR